MYFLNKQESSAGVDLDIFEKQLILNSADPLYHLDVSFWNKSSLLIFVTLTENKHAKHFLYFSNNAPARCFDVSSL